MTGRIRSLLAALAETPPPAVREVKRGAALADAVFKLEEIREWAERNSGGGTEFEEGFSAAAANVLRILDAP